MIRNAFGVFGRRVCSQVAMNVASGSFQLVKLVDFPKYCLHNGGITW
jgi:hypothetical protein